MHNRQSHHLKRGIWALLCLAVGIALIGCSSIGVENTSKDHTARVSMYLPDRSGSTSFVLAPGESGSELATESGLVVILVMPNEEYVKQLEELKKYYEAILKVPTFQEQDYRDATKKIGEFSEKIKQASLGGNSCYVRIDENMDVSATLTWDEANLTWKIACVARKMEAESSTSD